MNNSQKNHAVAASAPLRNLSKPSKNSSSRAPHDTLEGWRIEARVQGPLLQAHSVKIVAAACSAQSGTTGEILKTDGTLGLDLRPKGNGTKVVERPSPPIKM